MPFKNTNALVRRADPVAADEPRTADEERFHGLVGAWDDDTPLADTIDLFADMLGPEFRGWAEMMRGWAFRIRRDARSLSDSEPPPGLLGMLREAIEKLESKIPATPTAGLWTKGYRNGTLDAIDYFRELLAAQPQPALPSKPPDPLLERHTYIDPQIGEAYERHEYFGAEPERERAGDPLLQLARDVEAYCNDPKLVAQAKELLP